VRSAARNPVKRPAHRPDRPSEHDLDDEAGFEGLLLHRPALRIALWAGVGFFYCSLWLIGRGRLPASRVTVMLAVLGGLRALCVLSG